MISERWGWIAAMGIAVVFGAQVFFGSQNESLTWDEPGYISSGYVEWKWGDDRLAPDHPPLMQKLQALPLLAMDVWAPPLSTLNWQTDLNPRATYGRAFFFSSGNDPIRLAKWARVPVLILGMALVLCIYGFGRDLMRPDAALLACSLAAFDPNLIAHAKLATEDLGCTTLMLAAVWMFWRWLQESGTARATICGVVTGLALLSKYSALLLLPIDALLVVVWWLHTRPRIDWEARIRDLAAMAFVGLFVINFAYGFGFHLDTYVAGILQIYPDIEPDYQFYFWGNVSEKPFWYYAIASMAIKTMPSVWLLLILAVWSATRSPQARRAAVVLLVPMAAMLIASFFDLTQPGIRRVLPAVPFMLLIAGLALEHEARAAIRYGALLTVAASAVTAFTIYPHHLSYLSPLFGGPENGPYILDESNIDWGQDLPALAQWQAQNAPSETIALLYFGVAEPSAYGVQAVPLHPTEFAEPRPGLKAVSAHLLAGFRKLEAVHGLDADWLTKYEPIAKAGYSIFIYRFPEDDG